MFNLKKIVKQSADLSERLLLKHHFKDMMRFMDHTKLSRGSVNRLRELPWYLVVGATNSGKTSLLSNSGLQYILRKESKTSVSMQAKTQQPEWWATREAVLVDVPGQFWQAKTQQQKQSWQEFLKLIKRYHCPMAGIVVTVSARQLQSTWNQNQKQEYRLLAQRLQQVSAIIKQPSQCYLVVTQTDALPGFSEYFSTLDAEQQQQPWGFHCPRQGNESLEQVLADRFKEFLGRLHQSLITQLHHQRDPGKRDRMQRFPVQFEQCQSSLLAWAKQCYAGISSNPNVHFFGIYFTSSEQDSVESQKHDEVSKHFELQVYKPQPSYVRQSTPFFITQFFKKVVFNNSSLVSDVGWRRAINSHIVMGLTAFIILLGTSIWLYQFQTKFRAVASLQQALSDYDILQQHFIKDEAQLTIDDISHTLVVLDKMNHAINRYAKLTQNLITSLLTHHSRYDIKTREAYDKAVSQALIPQLLRLAEQRLQQFTASLDNASAKTLSKEDAVSMLKDTKAYLMLSHPEQLQIEYIHQWLQSFVTHKVDHKVLGKVTNVLAHSKYSVVPETHNKSLLPKVINLLQNYSVVDLMYLQIKEELEASHQDTKKTMRTNHALLLSEEQQVSVPAIFQATFASIVIEFIKHRIQEAPSEDWLLQQLQKSLVNSQQLEQALIARYWQDYLQTWHQYVTKFQLQPFKHMQGATQILSQFATPTVTPLEAHAKEVAAALEVVPASYLAMDSEFNLAQLQAYVNTDNATVWQPIIKAVQLLEKRMTRIAHDSNSAKAAYSFAKRRFENPTMQDELSILQLQAQTLPQPLRQMILQLVDNSWQVILADAGHYVNAVWITQVYPFYAERLSGRYPFAKDAKQSMTLKDFSAFFSPNGILAKFYQNYLQVFVDTGHTPWVMRVLDGHTLQIDDTHMAQLQYAYLLDRMFFMHSTKQPEVNFSLQLVNMTPMLSRFAIQMGDQYAVFQSSKDVAHKNFQWPDTSADLTSSLVFMTIDGRANEWKQQGDWSLFKLLDAAEVIPTDDSRRYLLRFDEDGNHIKLQLTTQDDLNPFIPDAIHRLSLPARLTT